MDNKRKTKKQLIGELEDWQRKFSELRRRVANIAHDLKSPIVCTVGFSIRLNRKLKNLTPEDSKTLKQLVKNARLVEEIARTLEDLTTIGESPLKIVRFDIQEVFDSIRATFFDDLKTKNIALILPERSIPIDADRVRIIRVFNNFFSNAFKYGGKQMTRIIAECKSSGKYWVFSVSNNGKGLSEEDCKRIFDPYTRHEENCEGVEGSGIGLSIVRRIAEKHGGYAWAVPGKRRGMTFFFKILKNPPTA